MIIRAPPKRNNALKGESPGRRDSGSAEVEVVGQGPVELEVGDGVGLGGVESRRLIEDFGVLAGPGHELRIVARAVARDRDERRYVAAEELGLEDRGEAPDDAPFLEFAEALTRGWRGESHGLGEIVLRHAGILLEQFQQLVVDLVQGRATHALRAFSVCPGPGIRRAPDRGAGGRFGRSRGGRRPDRVNHRSHSV